MVVNPFSRYRLLLIFPLGSLLNPLLYNSYISGYPHHSTVSFKVDVMDKGWSQLSIGVASTSFLALLSLLELASELDCELNSIFSSTPASPSSSSFLPSSPSLKDDGEYEGKVLRLFILGPLRGVSYRVAIFFPQGCFPLGKHFFSWEIYKIPT